MPYIHVLIVQLSVILCVCFRDHWRLFVGDSRGRVFSWTVSDSLGQCFLNSYKHLCVCVLLKCYFSRRTSVG